MTNARQTELKTIFKNLETPLGVARRAFLDYTCEFYNESNRAMRRGSCVYDSTATSPGCAHGQHMSAAVLDRINESLYSLLLSPASPEEWQNGNAITSECVWCHLEKWHRRLGTAFCQEIQQLHDNASLWDSEGLNASGLRFVHEIATAYSI